MSKETDNDGGYFENDNGLKIATKYWKPETDNPRALVYICHGVGEHCRVYDKVAKALNEIGVFVFSHDHVGHGKSDGDRCHVNTYDKYVQDVVKHVTLMKEKYPNKPVFIIGHSMGGSVTLLAVLSKPDMFKGMVLIGPNIVPSAESTTTFKVLMVKMIASILPQLHVGCVDPKFICKDPEVVKRYVEDPLNYHTGIKAKWAVATLAACEKIKMQAKELKLPWLDVHGDQDKLCEISGSQLLYEQSESEDKTFTVYKGGYHQVHNEPDGEGQKCINEIVAWIDIRI